MTRMWEVQKRNPTRQLMSLQIYDPQYTNTHLKGTNSNKVIKPSIILQAQNFTKQDMVKGTILHVVIKVRGYPPNRSDVAPSKESP
jgi:hypothetical protein